MTSSFHSNRKKPRRTAVKLLIASSKQPAFKLNSSDTCTLPECVITETSPCDRYVSSFSKLIRNQQPQTHRIHTPRICLWLSKMSRCDIMVSVPSSFHTARSTQLLRGSLISAVVLVTAGLPRCKTNPAKFVFAHRACLKSVSVQSVRKSTVQLTLHVITSAILLHRSATGLARISLGELLDHPQACLVLIAASVQVARYFCTMGVPSYSPHD